jgi:hypothetical protein
MATISTSINTNNRFLMDFGRLIEFTGGLIATSSNFSWSATGALVSGEVDVDIHGSGFTYSGSGDARELASGTISRISIDIFNDNGSETQGDLVITGTEGLIVSNIDKDDPRAFWNEVLKGDDVFILTGFAAVDIGVQTSTIFGDDLASATSPTPGVISDHGGNDTIVGADNRFHLIGDVVEIEGFNSGEFGFFPAEYDAGDDHILSAITDHRIVMEGDAEFVRIAGVLHGGNDVLDNSNSTGELSSTVGDALIVDRGTVYGGNDTIDTASHLGAVQAHGDGDVGNISAGAVIGGDDVIVAHGRSDLSGDVRFAALTIPPEGIMIDGGDDRITGSTSDDRASGDVGLLFQFDAPFATLLGGNDTIFGEAGNDQLFGEYGADAFTSISGGAVSGGNDRLDGGEGDDSLFGQTGNDSLNGGAGDDRLFGQSGRDSLNGGADTDRLAGGGGVDTLLGAGGDDVITGGAGGDTILGGVGRDIMTGDAGADRFVFADLTHSGTTAATRDHIRDFAHGLDRIDLRGIDAVPGGGDNAFTFVGTGAFTGVGQVRLVASNSDTIVLLNTLSGAAAESSILLKAVAPATIAGADFLL